LTEEVDVNASSKVKVSLKRFFFLLRNFNLRALTANLLMLSFILMTSIGAFLIFPAAGFITAGVCCGVFGYLLGSE
jgi:hypothetical protein